MCPHDRESRDAAQSEDAQREDASGSGLFFSSDDALLSCCQQWLFWHAHGMSAKHARQKEPTCHRLQTRCAGCDRAGALSAGDPPCVEMWPWK